MLGDYVYIPLLVCSREFGATGTEKSIWCMGLGVFLYNESFTETFFPLHPGAS